MMWLLMACLFFAIRAENGVEINVDEGCESSSENCFDDVQLLQMSRQIALTRERRSDPVLSPTCADIGSSSVALNDDGTCQAWVEKHCGKSWADTACPKMCGVCEVCEYGEWGNWSTCSSSCGGGGQYRTRGAGTCGEPLTEQNQCNTEACDPGPACSLKSSPPLVITEDNTEVDGLTIVTTGKEAAIWVKGASNVILRNIKIVHEGHARVTGANATYGYMDESGAGIYFQESPNILIENVHVSLVRPSPNPYATDGVCATEYCGPFPVDMKYAYNIYGKDSESPTLSNVYVTGGSTGFWCKNCAYGKVSHFKAENLHGPYPRGQCFQVVSSSNFLLEDFTCVQDNQIAFPEDDVSVWDSPYSTVRRGLIQGGNAPNGVAIITEMSDNVMVEDVDVTLVGGTTFSAYGSNNVTFVRCRVKDNHADGKCSDGQGYCKDMYGLWPNSNYYAGNTSVPDKTCCAPDAVKRCDTEGGIWFAGDYTESQAAGKHDDQASNISIQQGQFYNMTTIVSDEDFSNVGECLTITTDYWSTSAANRQEAYIEKDYKMEDFTLRVPFEPSFCFM